MNQLTTYIASPIVSISRFDHPKTIPHRDPRDEIASCYSINFIEKGSYSLSVGKRQWRMSHTRLFVTHPGMIFRCRHSQEFPEDVCFSVTYKPEVVDDDDEERWLRPSRLGCVVSLTNRFAYLHMRLTHLCASSRDPLTAEDLAAELLCIALERPGLPKRRLYSGKQLAWYVERVEAARHLLKTQYNDAHSLSSIARFTGMSPFHFARIFRELTGTPPHRYLMMVRLQQAAKMLLDGATVTETCFASGFANLSHFIRLFQRTFRLSPSQLAKSKKSSAARQIIECRNSLLDH